MFVRPDGVGGRDVAGQHLVEARALVAGEAEPDGGVALRVGVDQQRLVAGLGDAGGDVDRGGGLPHPALLVRDRVNGAHCALETSDPGGCRAPSTGVLRPFPPAADSPPASARPCGTRAGCGAPTRDTARPRAPPSRSSPSAAAACSPSASSRASTAPFHATSDPPSRSSGAAYSHSTGSAPSARAVTTSNGASSSSSARAHTTRTFSSPSASTVRSSHAHFFPTLSTSTTSASGRAIASTSPGGPAPAPRSTIRPASRTAGISSPASESAMCTFSPSRRSCTEVGADGSARRSSSVSKDRFMIFTPTDAKT